MKKVFPVDNFAGFGMAKDLKDHMNVEEAGKSVVIERKPVIGLLLNSMRTFLQ